MADWIRVRPDLYRDPKVVLIADALFSKDGELARFVNQNCQCDMSVTRNVMRNAVVGALVSVWGVARHQGRRAGDDLQLDNCTTFVIDDIADMPGFGSAMVAGGWCIESAQGLVFPKFFAEHNTDPKDAKREQNRVRQQRYRNARQQRDTSVTRSAKSNAIERERVIEREETVSKPPNPLSGGKRQPVTLEALTFPEVMNGPDVRKAVGEWLEHKRSIRSPYKTVAGVNRLIANWVMSGPAAFIDAIHNSIGQNYQGVHPRGGSNAGTSGTGGNTRQDASRVRGESTDADFKLPVRRVGGEPPGVTGQRNAG